MKLNQSNYFSVEAMTEYMSTSQFKTFEECQARGMHELKNKQEDRQCFQEGHYFEAALQGGEAEELFLMQNPNMISSRGETKGYLKANFQKVVGAVEAFKRQRFFMDIISKCESQVIVTGVIGGVMFKGCVDFYDPITGDNYDTKCMKDFKKIWSDMDGAKLNWYLAYGYHYQAAIYKELIFQTFGKVGNPHILGVTKEDVPDVVAFKFSDEMLKNAMEIIEEFAPGHDEVKRGLAEAVSCGICEYCKSTKIINGFEVVGEFE